MPKPNKSKSFGLGRLLATPGAIDALAKAGVQPSDLLRRHSAGDWGDLGQEDDAANDFAVLEGSRILSAYTVGDGVRIWIITEADRSATTILLPSEY